jgi:hypothetical protein
LSAIDKTAKLPSLFTDKKEKNIFLEQIVKHDLNYVKTHLGNLKYCIEAPIGSCALTRNYSGTDNFLSRIMMLWKYPKHTSK